MGGYPEITTSPKGAARQVSDKEVVTAIQY